MLLNEVSSELSTADFFKFYLVFIYESAMLWSERLESGLSTPDV